MLLRITYFYTTPTQQLTIIRKFLTFHRCDTVYLQHGGRKYCRQNDGTVTSYITAKLN